MSKNYISVEHAIRNIMIVEDWKANLTPEQRNSYVRKYGMNMARWPKPDTVQATAASSTSNQGEGEPGFLDRVKDFVSTKLDQVKDWGSDVADQVQKSKRTDNLGTSNIPGQSSGDLSSQQQSSNQTQIGYGDGKVDPRLASAAGIGPKLAGSEPTASKPSTSAETPEQKSTSNNERKSKTQPVPNIKLATKLSNLYYKPGMGAAARSEYLQKSADAAWAKPTRQNLSLRQRAEREQYGPSNR